MRISVLERLLTVEPHRRRMGADGEFVRPLARRYPTGPEEGPWFTSLSNGKFTLTRPKEEVVGQAPLVGQALIDCQLENEGTWFGELYRSLWSLSLEREWKNRCATFTDAIQCMVGFGFEPKTLAVPFSTLSEIVGPDFTADDADKITLAKGCVTEVDGVQLISARDSLPKGGGVLVAAKPLVGHYTRIHDYVGATLLRIDRAVVLIGGDALA